MHLSTKKQHRARASEALWAMERIGESPFKMTIELRDPNEPILSNEPVFPTQSFTPMSYTRFMTSCGSRFDCSLAEGVALSLLQKETDMLNVKANLFCFEYVVRMETTNGLQEWQIILRFHIALDLMQQEGKWMIMFNLLIND